MKSRANEIEELIEKVKTLRENKNNFQEIYDLICIEHEYEKLNPKPYTRYRFLLGETRKKEAEMCLKKSKNNQDIRDEFEDFVKNFIADLHEGLVAAKKELI